ncbi:ABC transporter permease [Limobrevibacterium gyesilva]|uniref:ABC transporter permease n=1 Tax=Limobrevibacterium gyesilva TaxID=2991712 RepID=A0AA42CDW1_9PROT|nr:ABC transporter permease [Limobrevibacterium gyesilva]
MTRAILSRGGELLFVAFGVSVLTFLMIHLVPGDAAQVMLGAADASPEKIAALRHQLGLDQTLVAQYAHWIAGALQGDLGTSVWTGRPVIEEIAGRVGVTIELTVLSLTAAIVIALPAGCLMATLRSSTAEYAVRVLSVAGITVPSFWLGAMLLYGAAAVAPNMQVVGYVPFAQDPLANLQRMLLPTIALALPVVASLARVVRASMQEALGQDYVRTARAKGLTERRVIFAHALRNALIPFLTTVGIMAGYLFGGSVVVEQVFALPGLGRLMVGAIAERNYPLIQAAILLATVTFVLVNFLVDLLYIAADPRARRT